MKYLNLKNSTYNLTGGGYIINCLKNMLTCSYSSDLSRFMQSDNIRIISDPEGFSLYRIANINDEQKNNTKVLVLGDLGDSTGVGKLSEHKHYNIRNLLDIKNNKNIHILLGNRDLNKIKCLPLLELQGEGIEEWYQGTDLTEMIETLKAKLNDKNWAWKIPTLKNWYPWWKQSSDVFNEYWQSPDETCHDRVMKIFGIDNGCDKNKCKTDDGKNNTGTMSAQNLLEQIIKEIKELGLVNNDLAEDDETKAALIVIVYRRMLDRKLRKFSFDGLLYDLFTSQRTYYCAFANMGKDLAIFSHGGMTKKFFEEADLIKKWEESANDNMVGGHYKDNIPSPFTKEHIKKVISEFNNKFKSGIKALLDKPSSMVVDEKPSKGMFLQLLIAVPTTPNGDKTISPNTLGPIMPGIAGFRNDAFTCSDCNIYQFIGHMPYGLAPTIDLYEGGNQQIFINLDTSNSLIGNAFSANVDDSNYSYLDMSNTNGLNMTIKTKVSLKPSISEKVKTEKIEIDFQVVANNTLIKTIVDKIKEHPDWSFQGKLTNPEKYLFVEIQGFTIIPHIVDIQ